MEFKKYKPGIEVTNNGTNTVFGGTLVMGSSTTTSSHHGHYWKYSWSNTLGYVRNSSRVLINNKPVTGWLYSDNYLVYNYSTKQHNNNNH